MTFFKNHIVKIITIYLLALLCVAAALFILNPREGGWPPQRLALVLGLIALILAPLAFLAYRWRTQSETSEVYRLKEYMMNEEEIKEAIALWVLVNQRKVIEGEQIFSMNDEGQLLARYYIPEE